MEIIVGLEVAFDAVQVDEDIIELFQQKEAARHALTAGNSVAFSG